MSQPIKRRPAPFSIRLTEEERQQLSKRAGARAIGSYVKGVLFGDGERRAAPARVTADRALLAKLLAVLGQSQVGPNLDALARAAASGSLLADPETTARLHGACDDVRLMHNALMRALGKDERPASGHELRATEQFRRAAEPEDGQ
jgi:hypothetical protein